MLSRDKARKEVVVAAPEVAAAAVAVEESGEEVEAASPEVFWAMLSGPRFGSWPSQTCLTFFAFMVMSIAVVPERLDMNKTITRKGRPLVQLLTSACCCSALTLVEICWLVQCFSGFISIFLGQYYFCHQV